LVATFATSRWVAALKGRRRSFLFWDTRYYHAPGVPVDSLDVNIGSGLRTLPRDLRTKNPLQDRLEREPLDDQGDQNNPENKIRKIGALELGRQEEGDDDR